MKQLYFHIGFTKTGSKSVQHALFNNRFQLKEKGILYPESICHKKSHRLLYQSLVPEGRQYIPEDFPHDFQHYLNRLTEEVRASECEKVILSCEDFFKVSDDYIARLNQYLSDFEVKVIVFLRRQTDWLESAYSQVVKANPAALDLSFIQFCQQRARFLDYHSLLTRWSDIFGAENIYPVAYKGRPTRGCDYPVSQLLDIVTGHPGNFSEFSQHLYMTANVSPGKRTIAAINLFKKEWMTRQDLQLLEEAIESLDLGKGKKYTFFTPELYEQIKAQSHKTNSEAAADFHSSDWPEIDPVAFDGDCEYAAEPDAEEISQINGKLPEKFRI